VILGVDGDFTGKRWWQVAATVLITGVAGYRGVWHPTSVAPSLETATNVSTIRARRASRGHPSPPAKDDAGQP
jgi:hypothetical protein